MVEEYALPMSSISDVAEDERTMSTSDVIEGDSCIIASRSTPSLSAALPEPEGPTTEVQVPGDTSRSTAWRLCSRAPRTESRGLEGGSLGGVTVER